MWPDLTELLKQRESDSKRVANKITTPHYGEYVKAVTAKKSEKEK